MADESVNTQTTVELSDNTQLSDVAQEFLSQPESKQNKVLVPTKADRRSARNEKPADEVEASSDEDIPPQEGDEDPEDLADEVGGLSDAIEKKVYKLKANGKEYEVDSEDKLKDMAQRGIAAMQNWEKVKSEVEALKADLRRKIDEADEDKRLAEKDLVSFAKKHNKSAEDLAEQLLLDRAREFQAMEGMTPREKELYLQNKDYQNKLKSRESEEKTYREKQEAELVETQKNQIAQVFSDALTKNNMPANSTTVRVMANIYRSALQAGKEPTMDQIVSLTKRHLSEIAEHSSNKIDDMGAEDFVAKYPKLTEAIRKHLVAKSKTRASEAGDVPRQAQRSNDGKFKPTEKLDKGKEWDKYIDKLKKEGNALNVKSRW